MFSFGFNELLIIIFVAILVIAPNDLPRVMKTLGKFLARTRLFTRDINSHFNNFIDNALLADEVEDEEEGE
jgi:sec-independent protein translocase protein TatB